jgi:hypothetical protein
MQRLLFVAGREIRLTRVRAVFVLVVMAAALGACSSAAKSGTGTTSGGGNSTNPGGATSTTLSPSAEYLLLVAPVDRAEAAFKASRTGPEAEAAAGPFAAALTTWSHGLAAYSWPSNTEPDVQTLIAAIPPEVADLDAISGGDVADIPKAAVNGAPITAAALKIRGDLGLPETT